MGTYSHLLIDGYNVIHSWPELRCSLRKSGDGGAAAREQLVASVRIIHDAEALPTTLVFDGKGDKTQIRHPGREPSFSIIYAAAGISADGVIEQLVAKSLQPQGFVAATRDAMISESLRALGATTITPEALRDWIDQCTEKQSRKLAEQQRLIALKWGQGLDLTRGGKGDS